MSLPDRRAEPIGGKQADPERRRAAVERLGQLREAWELTAAHVRLAASGLGVRERTVWRWLSLAADQPGTPDGRGPYQLSEADREASARYRGNVAAVHRARAAVLASPVAPVVLAAGVLVPASLREGWRGAPPVTERTLQRAFRRELTAAEAAAWAEGEEGQRAAGVYLTRPAGHRNEVWEMDHKQLPILVMPPRGAACCPWLTSVIDDATRVLAGWVIALTPHTGTVLTAVRMALAHDPARGPFGAIPARVRIDRGLEFAAEAVRDAFAALSIDPRRMPGLRARPGWAAAEAALKETGLIYSISGPDEVHVSGDVRFSLRYSDDDHIARELGEPPPPAQALIPRPGPTGPGRVPASEQPGSARPPLPGPGRDSRPPPSLGRGGPEDHSRLGQPGPGRYHGPRRAATARSMSTMPGPIRRTCRCLGGEVPPRRCQRGKAAAGFGALAAIARTGHPAAQALAATDISCRRTDNVVSFPLTFRVVPTDIVVSLNSRHAAEPWEFPQVKEGSEVS